MSELAVMTTSSTIKAITTLKLQGRSYCLFLYDVYISTKTSDLWNMHLFQVQVENNKSQRSRWNHRNNQNEVTETNDTTKTKPWASQRRNFKNWFQLLSYLLSLLLVLTMLYFIVNSIILSCTYILTSLYLLLFTCL